MLISTNSMPGSLLAIKISDRQDESGHCHYKIENDTWTIIYFFRHPSIFLPSELLPFV